MSKQVNKSHYKFSNYLTKGRWSSIWHQIDEVVRANPDRVLEIGPGPNIFKSIANNLGLLVETLDIDPELMPDHVASVFDMPFKSDSFDVVCAFQMLEHLPFEKSIEAFREMARVARKNLIISLPNSQARWPFSLYIPRIGEYRFSIARPRFSLQGPIHNFDGEHYWEIGKLGYSLTEVKNRLLDVAPLHLTRSYRVHENFHHHFFVFEKYQ